MAGTKKLVGKHLKVAHKALTKVTDFLERLNIHYIVDCGTLLGMIREDRLLPWDDDVDLSIKRSDAEFLVKNRWRLWLMGYRTCVRHYRNDDYAFNKGDVRLIKIQTRKWLFFKKDNVLDIFIKDAVGDEYQMALGRNPSVLQGIPKTFLDETVSFLFGDKTYSIPKAYQEYLTFIYGDWRTPVKEWNFLVDAKCNKY
ncbi:LicD family protein [Thalassotalea sp. PLHSN55]|uniref:LicD family protein n=1 Tax=Thalassotalea sp. PLHSN55 TaxID=3435888 RepID=UPI003F876B53